MTNIPYFSDDKNRQTAENVLQKEDVSGKFLAIKNYNFSTALNLNIQVGEAVITRQTSADSYSYEKEVSVINSGTYIIIKLPSGFISMQETELYTISMQYTTSSYTISTNPLVLYNFCSVNSIKSSRDAIGFLYARSIRWMIIRMI